MEVLNQIVHNLQNECASSTILLLGKIMQSTDDEKTVISTVNSLLLNAKTRTLGLELINSLIPQFSRSVIIENAYQWINCCGLSRSEDATELKFKVLEKLIAIIGETEESKKFISDHLPKIVKCCLTYQPEKLEVDGVLKCLTQCMKSYPTWFLNYREEIELFLIKFIGNRPGKHVQDAAMAFHYLLQTGGPGQDGVNYINNFRNGFRKLCNTVLFSYNLFPEYFRESEFKDREIFTLTPLSSATKDNQSWEVVAGTILNSLVFIQVLIEKKFPFEKQIMPGQIVDIVTRGLQQHCCLQEGNFSTQKHSLLLTKIHVKLLQLLQVSLIGNTTSMVPFTYAITKTLFISLEKCNSCQHCTKDFRYKQHIYKTLTVLMELGNAFNHPHFQEVLVSSLLRDMKLDHNLHVLNFRTEKQAQAVRTHKLERSSVECTTRKKLYSMALTVMKTFLQNYPLKIKQQQQQDLVSLVVEQLHNSACGNDTIANLYRILCLLLRQEFATHTPTIHSIIAILTKGLHSSDYTVSNASREGLETIESLTQSVCSVFLHNPWMQAVPKEPETEMMYPDVDSTVNQNGTELPSEKTDIRILSDIKITPKGVEEVPPEDVTTVSDSQPSTEDVEFDLTSDKTGDAIEENESKEPPPKKIKSESDGLGTMISSFQDEIQH